MTDASQHQRGATTLLDQLRTHFEGRFGPHAAAATVLLATCLTGRTASPLAARTIGNSDLQSSLSVEVERLLGRSCLYLTSVSDHGIETLDGKSELVSLILEPVATPLAREAVHRLVLGEPIRVLTATASPRADRQPIEEPQP